MIKSNADLQPLADEIKSLGLALGFQQVGITDTELSEAENQLSDWLDEKSWGQPT